MRNWGLRHWNALRLVSALVFSFRVEIAYSEIVAEYFQHPVDGTLVITQRVGGFDFDTYWGNHLGQDIAAAVGEPVFAVADGVVKYSKNNSCLGHAIHIEHTLPDQKKIVSVYYHLKPLGQGGIELGPTVKRGQLIGAVWQLPKNCGTGPHLHFGLRPGPYEFDTDQRTERWFYPGYSSIFLTEIRQKDPSDPTHAQITAEWVDDPLAYIDAKLAQSHPPSNIITFVASGTAQGTFDPKGVLPAFLSQPYVNVPATAEITFDKTTPDFSPVSSDAYGNYLPISIVVTIGTNTPVTFIPEPPLGPYSIGIITGAPPGSRYHESMFLVLAGKFVCSGCERSPAFQFGLTGGPATYFATDALPTTPPDISQFPSTEWGGTTGRLSFCSDALAPTCGTVLINVTSLTLKE